MPVETSKRREKAAEYYRKNRERILARNKAHYEVHRQEKSKYSSEHYKKHKARIDSRNAAYRKAHPQQVALLAKRWRMENREMARQIGRRCYARHREQYLAQAKLAKAANPERRRQIHLRSRLKHAGRIREYQKRYARQHPEVYVASAQKRRALAKLATVNLGKIKEWMASIRSHSFAVCYYCQSKVRTDSVHFDHIVALNKGGSHSVENLCVSCSHCNATKSDKPLRAWVRIGQQILEL